MGSSYLFLICLLTISVLADSTATNAAQFDKKGTEKGDSQNTDGGFAIAAVNSEGDVQGTGGQREVVQKGQGGLAKVITSDGSVVVVAKGEDSVNGDGGKAIAIVNSEGDVGASKQEERIDVQGKRGQGEVVQKGKGGSAKVITGDSGVVVIAKGEDSVNGDGGNAIAIVNSGGSHGQGIAIAKGGDSQNLAPATITEYRLWPLVKRPLPFKKIVNQKEKKVLNSVMLLKLLQS